MPLDWRETLKQLLPQFEARASQSLEKTNGSELFIENSSDPFTCPVYLPKWSLSNKYQVEMSGRPHMWTPQKVPMFRFVEKNPPDVLAAGERRLLHRDTGLLQTDFGTYKDR